MRATQMQITGTRREILGIILANPGIHFRAIARELDIGVGTVDYHLHALTRAELIHSTTVKNSRCIYPQGGEDHLTALLRRDSLRNIVVLLLSYPQGMRITQIAAALGKSPSTISAHASTLREARVLHRETDLLQVVDSQMVTKKLNAMTPTRMENLVENYVKMWVD